MNEHLNIVIFSGAITLKKYITALKVNHDSLSKMHIMSLSAESHETEDGPNASQTRLIAALKKSSVSVCY